MLRKYIKTDHLETKDIVNVNVDAIFFERISALIEESGKKVAAAVNIAEVYTEYEIGRYIVGDEQEGKARAAYGKQVLDVLARKLTVKFEAGWTVDTLKRCLRFKLEPLPCFDAHQRCQRTQFL